LRRQGAKEVGWAAGRGQAEGTQACAFAGSMSSESRLMGSWDTGGPARAAWKSLSRMILV